MRPVRLADAPPTDQSRPRAPRLPARLTLSWRLTVYFIALGLWISGAAWLVFHYFMMRETQFGPAPQPAEFWVLTAHAAFGFLALLLLGAMWERHISRAWPIKRRRRSGLTFLLVVSVLIVTGFLLYYVGGDTARVITSVLHWGLGLAAPVFFFAHRYARR